MAEKDTQKVTLFEDVYNESTSDSLYNDFLTGIQAGGGDITGLTKDIFKKQYESIYEKEFVKTYGFSQKDFKPPAREEGGFESPKIEGPSLGQKTSEFFGRIPEEAMIIPSVFAAKYLGGKGEKVAEGLRDVTERGFNYLKTVLPGGMPAAEVAHFMDNPQVNEFLKKLTQIESKISGLDPKVKDDLIKINKLKRQHQKVLAEGAKVLTTKGTQTAITPGLKIIKGGEVIIDDATKLVESSAPTRTTGQFPRIKTTIESPSKYKVKNTTFLESYKGRGYNVDEKTMRNVLKNHKNWSLFQFKGEISKVGRLKAAKDFFKKGTAITKIGQDLVSWKIGEGIGDVITEQTGVDFWGKDIAAGATGMWAVPKIARKLGQFIENLPAKAIKFSQDSKTQRVVNQILKKRTGQTLTQIVAAYGSGGILTGPGAGVVIGLTGLGLTINDIRKLFKSYNEGDSEEKIEMSIEDALKKVDLPEDK